MLTILNMILPLLVLTAGVAIAFHSGSLVQGLVLAGTGGVGTALAGVLVARSWRIQAESLALGRIGHELRTPLAVMTAWLDQFRTPSEGEACDPEVLDRQIRRMRVMVEGTLQGTRRLGRPGTPRTSTPCLRRGGSGLPLDGAVADLTRLWPGPEATFGDEPAAGIAIPRLRWDRGVLGPLAQVPGDDRFQHILANVVQNAFRHGVPRARPLVRPWEVVVRMALDEDGSLVVEVVDEGPGVKVHPLTGLPTSLDPETRRGVGTGLGFYLVQELVASAGGSLFIGHRTGGRHRRGTLVRIVLPVEEIVS